MRLTEALDRFSLQLRADGRSAHTIGQYARAIALLERWMVREGRSTDLAAFSPEVLALFLVSRDVRDSARGGAKATVTVNATRTSLRVFFRWLADAGYMPTNPARLVRRAVCSAPPPKALSDLDVQRLLDTLIVAQGPVARRDHLLIHLLLATGVRIGSALALDVSDIDLDAGTLRLRTVKGDRVERVFIGRNIRDHLVGYLARKPRTGPLIRGPQGERLTKRQAQTRIRTWLERAEVAGTPHSLRHTFATRLLRRTGDLFLVKAALLHRSIASTAVYLSVSDDRLRAALDSMGEVG